MTAITHHYLEIEDTVAGETKYPNNQPSELKEIPHIYTMDGIPGDEDIRYPVETSDVAPRNQLDVAMLPVPWCQLNVIDRLLLTIAVNPYHVNYTTLDLFTDNSILLFCFCVCV